MKSKLERDYKNEIVKKRKEEAAFETGKKEA